MSEDGASRRDSHRLFVTNSRHFPYAPKSIDCTCTLHCYRDHYVQKDMTDRYDIHKNYKQTNVPYPTLFYDNIDMKLT